jgi:carboxymethylenebutenolidase
VTDPSEPSSEPSSDPRPASAGSAYLVVPDDGPGHGVLVLHSWWGLTPAVKAVVEALADAGYTAMAPDLLDGALPTDGDEARDLLADSDPNETAALVLSSIVALRAHSADPSGPVAVLGFSMGASWGLWVATRQPDSVDAVVAYYGVQNIDFEALRAPVLGHFAETDPLVTDDELVEMQAHLLLLDKHVEVHHYPGTGHWFAEPDRPEHHDEEAAALAWDRTLAFLAAHTEP